jgi:hypothetical protein
MMAWLGLIRFVSTFQLELQYCECIRYSSVEPHLASPAPSPAPSPASLSIELKDGTLGMLRACPTFGDSHAAKSRITVPFPRLI